MVAHGRFSKETFEGVYRALPVVDKFGHMKDANAPSKVKIRIAQGIMVSSHLVMFGHIPQYSLQRIVQGVMATFHLVMF